MLRGMMGRLSTKFAGAVLALLPCAGLTQGLPAPVSDSDYRLVDPAEAGLGQLLFYDPILSGN